MDTGTLIGLVLGLISIIGGLVVYVFVGHSKRVETLEIIKLDRSECTEHRKSEHEDFANHDHKEGKVIVTVEVKP